MSVSFCDPKKRQVVFLRESTSFGQKQCFCGSLRNFCKLGKVSWITLRKNRQKSSNKQLIWSAIFGQTVATWINTLDKVRATQGGDSSRSFWPKNTLFSRKMPVFWPETVFLR